MILKEAQTQWLRRAHDLALERTRDPDFAMAFASKLFEQTRMNPTHRSNTGVGIANLDPELEIVDPLNPEDAIQFALERDAIAFENTGEVLPAILDSLSQGGDPAPQTVRNIQENAPMIESALFGTDETFTDINSPERRFRHAVRTDDAQGTTGVIDELIDNRIGQSNRA